MSNKLNRCDTEQMKKYSLENDKIYKNVKLFSLSTLSKEVTNLQASIEEKNIFLNKCEKISKKKFDKNNKNLHNATDRNSNNNRTSKNTLLPSLNSDVPKNYQSKNSEIRHDTFFLTKNESQHKTIFSQNIFDKSSNNVSLFITERPGVNYTRYLTGLNESKILSMQKESNKIKNKQEDAAKLKILYRKIFRTTGYRPLHEIHLEKHKEKEQKLQSIHRKIIKSEDPKKYHCEKIKEIRSKLNFMKGIIDYAYPIVSVKRLKYQNIYFNTYMEKHKQTEILKNEKAKNSNNNFIDINEYLETDSLIQSNARNSGDFYLSKDMKESNKKFSNLSYNNNRRNISLIPKKKLTADSLRFLSEESF